ncbi:hypothetical protein [Edaphobacter modestus]|uniref:hypothetical protein n=1 Tax=Edaphobacter modestus TaxID=388466 RepID=UPI00102B62AB|nr:hypothetical protein [Edaphobacter modestus]
MQLRRLVNSETLRNSLTLVQLLDYLGRKSLEGKTEGLKEYTIGVEAFGRKSTFDPKTDTIVRVQIHRLRQKLKEYYQQEGMHDPVLVDIPRGSYHPTFRPKVVDVTQQQEINPDEVHAGIDLISKVRNLFSSLRSNPSEIDQSPTSAQDQATRPLAVPTEVALILFALAAGYFAGNYQATSAIAGDAPAGSTSHFARKPKDPVKILWASFLGNDTAPIIAYPNAVFLLDDSNDLFRFRQGASDNRGARVDPDLARKFAANPVEVGNAGQLYYEDGYTGTGELESVAMLTTLFAQMGLKPTIKTSRNITPQDLQQHTVILLGSPFQNIAVSQLLATGDFTFRNPDSRREQWRAQIVNAHPSRNEDQTYHTERDPETQVLKRDYSLISIQPGVVEGHNIVVIGGLDTKGTEGATQFATSRSGVETLSAALTSAGFSVADGKNGAKSGTPWFQALVLVHLEKGDQVLSSELRAVHPFPDKK